jgi:MinD-like ATPase involved in chromosome partitioning or flagellar assembly
VSGRESEPTGVGQNQTPRSDFSWLSPPEATHGADSQQSFGPGQTPLDDDGRTDSTTYPAAPHQQPAGPQYAEHPSGPQYVEQTPSGPHAEQSGPRYVDPSQVSPPYVDHPSDPPYVDHPSGPQYVDPNHAGSPYAEQPSGPQYVDPNHAGSPYAEHPSGPQYVDPASSGPQYVDRTPSGPQQFPPVAPPQPPGAFQYPPPHGQGDPLRQPLADELSSAHLIKPSKRKPQSGWRKAVFVASGRLINVGEAPQDVRRRELITRVNQPLRGCYKIAMLSLKGGVGKTTTTTTLGSTFSSLRGDRVIAVDANPDRGTLSQKIPLETTATVRHLLRDAERIRRYSDIRAYTSQGPSRLEVLASEQDPAVSEAFSEDDYRRTVALLEHFYNIVLTDCGTGLMHSAMKGVLDLADSLVVVSSGSVDGARSASATLDWLDVHGYRDLVARSVAVINSVRPRAGSVDLDKLAQHFGARCRAVCRIPFDPHLEEGAEIELDRLAAPTRLALLELAATVADGFPSDYTAIR